MGKKVIIVGAGIAGLSAGNYAQRNGFSSEIFEMHDIPGGLCTAWERKGYKWDISMHMLTGSVSGPFHQMWRELGIIQQVSFTFHQEIARIEGKEHQLLLSTDREQLEQDLINISPEDEKLIRAFTRLLFGRDLMKAASLKPASLKNLSDRLKPLPHILPLLPVFRKYGNQTIQEFASKFKHPFLREAIRFVIDAPGWPMTGFPMTALAGFMHASVSQAGAPVGGSQHVINLMADSYLKSGGQIHFGERVTDLIRHNDRVHGIRLENGEEIMADEIIWAADGHTLLFEILQQKYISQEIKDRYNNWLPVKPLLHVMFGVKRDFSHEPHRIILQTETPVQVANKTHEWLAVLHHCFDPTMAPEGKTALEVWFDTDYDYWAHLRNDRDQYRQEKKRIAGETLNILEKRWPGLSQDIEVTDVATPSTYVRYTGNWQASPDGWYITPDNMMAMEPLREVPRLSGIQMIGQWTAPFTGTVIAALTGRQAIQLLCKKAGIPFRGDHSS